MKHYIIVLIIFGLFTSTSPIYAGFFDWLPWIKKEVKIETPASVIPASECPICQVSEPQTIIKEKPVEKIIIKEVPKEITKEVIVYKDFKDDPTYKATLDVFNRCQEGLKENEKGYTELQNEFTTFTIQIKELQENYIKLADRYKSLKTSSYSLITNLKKVNDLAYQIGSQQISPSLLFQFNAYNFGTTVSDQNKLIQSIYDIDKNVSSTQEIIDGF